VSSTSWAPMRESIPATVPSWEAVVIDTTKLTHGRASRCHIVSGLARCNIHTCEPVAGRWRWVQLATGTYPLSTPGNPLESTDYLNEKGKKINPVLWAIKQLKKSGVTVVRFFGGGVTTDFKMIKTPGTAGANGKTWPNGVLLDGSAARSTLALQQPPSVSSWLVAMWGSEPLHCVHAVAGKMNWEAVDGLDKIVGWCRAHGIKIIISFLDNWSPVDSKPAVSCCTVHASMLPVLDMPAI
jgi:hypothetical protein